MSLVCDILCSSARLSFESKGLNSARSLVRILDFFCVRVNAHMYVLHVVGACDGKDVAQQPY